MRGYLLVFVLVAAMVTGTAGASSAGKSLHFTPVKGKQAITVAGTAGANSAGKSLHFTLVKGKQASNVCNIATGDVLKANGSGFAPNGQFVTIPFYPTSSRFHGGIYTYLQNHGVGQASATGTTPRWSWNCTKGADNRPDPVGTYRLIIVDVQTAQAWGGYIKVINK